MARNLDDMVLSLKGAADLPHLPPSAALAGRRERRVK
jgi:hypothetical protein